MSPDPIYRARIEIPALVEAAMDLARRNGFTHSSIPEVGHLLSVLTTSIGLGSVAEIGTGYGVGAAWMVTGLRKEATLYTIDVDARCSEAARSLLQPFPNVRVLHGDWRNLQAHGPFDLLFADGGKAKELEPDTLIDLLSLGGMIVLDDLTAEEFWPEEWKGMPDPVRTFWLNSRRVLASELRVTKRDSVILATRIG